MAKIKINDLPKDQKISKDEMKKVFGGILTLNSTGYLTPKSITSIKDPLVLGVDADTLNIEE